MKVACTGATWTFTGLASPGTQLSSVMGDGVSVPRSEHVQPVTLGSGATANVSVDLPVRSVSGKLTRNGADVGTPCATGMSLSAINLHDGSTEPIFLSCNGPV